MATDNASNLLYPELLSTDTLISLLQQRYIPDKDLPSLSKDDLVLLYYHYILPLPQRKYRMNRRGKEMTRKQVILSKKRKMIEFSDSGTKKKKHAGESELGDPTFLQSAGVSRLKPPISEITGDKKKICLNSKTSASSPEITADNEPLKTSGLVTSFGQITTSERIKPPPSCINTEKKTVKLSSKISSPPSTIIAESSVSPTDAGKSRSAIKAPSSVTKEPTSGGFKTPINVINKHLSSNKKVNITSHLKVKSGQCMQADENNHGITKNDTADDNNGSPKKLKLSRIKWP